MTEDRGQKTDDKGQVEEVGMRKWENGSGNLEVRSRKSEVGNETRRRPIGLDYAAAKDVEMGIRKSEVGKVKHRIKCRRQMAEVG
jgi:hypothetical protein